MHPTEKNWIAFKGSWSGVSVGYDGAVWAIDDGLQFFSQFQMIFFIFSFIVIRLQKTAKRIRRRFDGSWQHIKGRLVDSNIMMEIIICILNFKILIL